MLFQNLLISIIMERILWTNQEQDISHGHDGFILWKITSLPQAVPLGSGDFPHPWSLQDNYYIIFSGMQ